MFEFVEVKSATLSQCERYRHILSRSRIATSGIVIGYFGVNPSTADGVAEDQTTKKLTVFTRLNGGKAYLLGNGCDLRATDVRELARSDAPVSKWNDDYIDRIIAGSDLLIPCWGDLAKVPESIRPVFSSLLRKILSSGKPVKVFGFTKRGHPKHPLMLGYNTQLVNYPKTVLLG